MPRKQSSHDILQHATINHYKQLLRVTRVTHVEQEQPTLPGLLSSSLVLVGFVLLDL